MLEEFKVYFREKLDKLSDVSLLKKNCKFHIEVESVQQVESLSLFFMELSKICEGFFKERKATCVQNILNQMRLNNISIEDIQDNINLDDIERGTHARQDKD